MAPRAGERSQIHPAAGDRWVMPGRHPQPRVGRERHVHKAGEVTKRPRVYELKIRGVASDLVRAEFDDVELWEGPGATCLRTGAAGTGALCGLIKGMNKIGLLVLKDEELRAGGPHDA